MDRKLTGTKEAIPTKKPTATNRLGKPVGASPHRLAGMKESIVRGERIDEEALRRSNRMFKVPLNQTPKPADPTKKSGLSSEPRKKPNQFGDLSEQGTEFAGASAEHQYLRLENQNLKSEVQSLKNQMFGVLVENQALQKELSKLRSGAGASAQTAPQSSASNMLDQTHATTNHHSSAQVSLSLNPSVQFAPSSATQETGNDGRIGAQNNEITKLNEKIKALEEYCLNVDYLRFPVPPALNYLFVKTTGTCEFYDNNPPVDRSTHGGVNYGPVEIPPAGRYEYEGDLINGKPGGNGTIKYGKKAASDNCTYSCTYTGTFLNGMKHGKGQLEVKGFGESACAYQQRYTYDKKDGIFVIRYEDGRMSTFSYEEGQVQHVMKSVTSDYCVYTDMKDDLNQGNVIHYYTKDERVSVCKNLCKNGNVVQGWWKYFVEQK